MVDERTYKYEVMLAFWLSVELEKVEETRVLIEIDPIIEQIVINLRDNAAIWLKSQAKINERRLSKGLSFLLKTKEEEKGNKIEQTKKGAPSQDYEGIDMNEAEEGEEIQGSKFSRFKGAIKEKANDKLPETKSQEEIDAELDLLKQLKTTAKIRNLFDVQKLKDYIKSKIGSPFSTNVLRIALNFKEVTIASTLVAFYKVQLDEQMLVRAIKTN